MNKKNSSAKRTPPKVNLGTKRQCPHCGTKFYDFAKPEIVCPKCEKKVDPHAEVSYRREAKRAAPSRVVEALDEEADIVVEDRNALESADDLDDADVTQDIEVEEDN